MKKQNKKKKYLVAASALALLALGAGTFAWFTSKDEAVNHFEGQMAANDITLVETYVPEKDWEPNEEVNKDVAVKNESKYDAFIRVSFKEALSLLKNDNEIRYDGTDYVREGVVLATPPVAPIIVPSPTDYTTEGFTDVTTKVTNAPTDLTVGTETYKFVLYAKSTTTPAGDTEVTYVAQWHNAKGNAKAYIANLSSAIAFDKTADTYTITAGTVVQLSMIDKEYDAEKTANWPVDALVNTPVTGDLEEFNGIVEAPTAHNIQLLFAPGTLTATPTANKWFYNADDGYFYYCAIVPGGGMTAQLLDAVKLNGKAGNEYSLMQYDLTVLAEGLQAVKNASVDEWDVTGDLKTLLEGLVA